MHDDSALAAAAVNKLASTHTVSTPAGDTIRGPLLDWAEEMVTTQDSGGGSGSSGPGVPINDRAFDLVQTIRQELNLMCQAYGVHHADTLAGLTRSVWASAHAAWLLSRVEAHAWRALTRTLVRWVAQIEAQADRPRTMELTVPCPQCGYRWVPDENDNRTAAITIQYLPDQPPVAECQWSECGGEWSGWEEVQKLGATIGAAQDRAVLAACGLPVPSINE